MNSSSVSFYLSFCFVAQNHVSLFLMWLPFNASVSSGLRKSLISSCHLFFGLPTALHVLILVLRPGFHAAAFLPIILLVAMLFSSPISTSFFYVFRSNMGSWLHSIFFRFSCASFYVFDPVLLCNFCCVDFFICVFREGDVAVLVAICVGAASLFSFVSGAFAAFFSFLIITLLVLRLFVILWFFSLLVVLCLLLVLPFRLYNESEHFALSRSYHSFVFVCQGPRSRRIAQRRKDHHVEQAEPVLQEVIF